MAGAALTLADVDLENDVFAERFPHDEDVFDEPYRFDVGRRPNRHSLSAAAGRTSAWGRIS